MRHPSERPERPDDPQTRAGRGSDRGRAERDASEYAGAGLALGLSIALFALAGNWLDDRLGTQPVFVLIGVFVGFAAGFYSLYARLVLSRDGRAEKSDPGGADADGE